MTYKAFIIGINTLGLKYSDRDAALMGAALSRNGYDTYIIDKEENKREIISKFVEVMAECQKLDTIIFYFSGYAKIDRGQLFLNTEGDGSRELSIIPINEIIGPLQRCVAKRKLIILDCSHAGKIGAVWNNPEASDICSILVAANPLETVNEIDDLQASFMTHRIHLALTETPKDLLKDGKISINNLSKWLREQVGLYNARSPIKVPQPYLIGSDRADFDICISEKSLIKPVADKTRISYGQLIDELKEWKMIQTKSQSLEDKLATIIKCLDISGFETEDFDKFMNDIECGWNDVFSISELQTITKEFRYIAEEEVVQNCLHHANSVIMKSISHRIKTAKTAQDALEIKRSLTDIKLDFDNLLHVADIQITRLSDELKKNYTQSQQEPLPPLATNPRTKVFVSYSHKDMRLFGELKTMLAPVIQKGSLDIWDDTKIKIGTNWQDEIKAAVATAKVGMLLVSPYFLASDFISKNELPPLLKAAQDAGVTIFWVCLSSCLYGETEIRQYQAAHDVRRPLDTLTKAKRNATLKEICDKLLQIYQVHK